jgi:hypothetical protein
MTVSVTAVQEANLPSDLESDVSGVDGERLAHVYIQCSTTATGDTLDLSDYAGLDDLDSILGFEMQSLDGANITATTNTWSGTTITFDAHSGSGNWDILVLATYG